MPDAVVIGAGHNGMVAANCDLLVEAVAAGDVRDDIAPQELTQYCLHALTAASSLTSKAALARLVAVTLAELRAPTER